MLCCRKGRITLFNLVLACFFFPIGGVPFIEAAFGEGSGPIFLDNVVCSGTETVLLNCSNSGIGSHDCIHYEDAGVRCQSELQLICMMNFIVLTTQ